MTPKTKAARFKLVAPQPEPIRSRPRDLKAPSHLQPATQAWWLAVNADYALEEHHQRLLTLAAESWDRCGQARAAIDQNGLTFVNALGEPRTRPEVAIERDARIGFARLLRELDLDVPPPDEGRSRPPALHSNRGT